MNYLSWAVYYEGSSDSYYLETMLPRLIADIVAQRGTGNAEIPERPALVIGKRSRNLKSVAEEACDNRLDFALLFIHADTGGRNVERSLRRRGEAVCSHMHDYCGWPAERCVVLAPRQELEAWLLADPTAVLSVLGYSGSHDELGLPSTAREAERLTDPKKVLNAAAQCASGPRRRTRNVENLYAAIAQRQRLAALRASRSFMAFETALVMCLVSLRAVRE